MIDIRNTNAGVKTWEINLFRDKIFKIVSSRTNYINQRTPREQRDENRVLMDGDRDVFDKYFDDTIADMVVILAKGFKGEFTDYNIDHHGVYFIMLLTSNHKDSVAFSLNNYCAGFMEAKILMKWFGNEARIHGLEMEADEFESKIRSVTRYRKSTIQRPIHPIF